eukprot:1252830-Amphidinium_carterae.1
MSTTLVLYIYTCLIQACANRMRNICIVHLSGSGVPVGLPAPSPQLQRTINVLQCAEASSSPTADPSSSPAEKEFQAGLSRIVHWCSGTVLPTLLEKDAQESQDIASQLMGSIGNGQHAYWHGACDMENTSVCRKAVKITVVSQRMTIQGRSDNGPWSNDLPSSVGSCLGWVKR